MFNLIVEPEAGAGELARNLIEKTKQELENNQNKKQLLELIETIVIYY